MEITNKRDKKEWKMTIKYVQFDSEEERERSYKLWVESLLKVKTPENC